MNIVSSSLGYVPGMTSRDFLILYMHILVHEGLYSLMHNSCKQLYSTFPCHLSGPDTIIVDSSIVIYLSLFIDLARTVQKQVATHIYIHMNVEYYTAALDS